MMPDDDRYPPDSPNAHYWRARAMAKPGFWSIMAAWAMGLFTGGMLVLLDATLQG